MNPVARRGAADRRWKQFDLDQLRERAVKYPSSAVETALDAAQVTNPTDRERGRQAIRGHTTLLILALHQRGRASIPDKRRNLLSLQKSLERAMHDLRELDPDAKNEVESAAAASPYFDDLDGGDIQINRLCEALRVGHRWVVDGVGALPQPAHGRAPKQEIQNWIDGLVPIYEELTGRRATVSSRARNVDDERAVVQVDEGPFLIFVKALLAPLGMDASGRLVRQARRAMDERTPKNK